MQWDVFICHASEDKESVVGPLARELTTRGLKVWFDEFSLHLGDSLSRSIDLGLSQSRFGVVVLSPAFFSKTWPQNELHALIARQAGTGTKIVLPVWHNLSRTEVESQSPLLASLMAVSTDKGMHHVAEEIAAVVAVARGRSAPEDCPSPTTTEILVRYVEAIFSPLQREEPRSPLELTKEIPQEDNVLPLMARLPRIRTIPGQIEYLQEHHYAQTYSNSWPEHEAVLMGRWLLTSLTQYVERFDDMYDAGCANLGQFKAIMTMEERIADRFHYYAQDFNPDWQERFSIGNGEFFLRALPLVPEITCGLVACTHTLHFLAQHPIAVYTTMLSFNTLLRGNGLCYVTVPEKESQPGMLDLLERAAVDGRFSILKSGRCRLTHRLTKEPSHNITTFLYLILRKEADVDPPSWRRLLGLSCFRCGYLEGATENGVSSETDIRDCDRLLEMDLEDLFAEQNRAIRTFRLALDVAYAEQASARTSGEQISHEEDILSSIVSIHRTLLEVSSQSPARHSRLSEEAARYLVCLARWYVARYPGKSTVEIMHQVRPILERVLGTATDIRVHLHDLSTDQIARLIKHLFELSRFAGIDLREFVRLGGTHE